MEENVRVVSLTRHSFRGVEFFNSLQIFLSDDLILPNPFLTWNGSNNTDANFHIQIEPINRAVSVGFSEIGIRRPWCADWREIRADFLYQRTFETGRILRNRIKKKPDLSAVIDKDQPDTVFSFSNNNNIDAVVFPVKEGDFNPQVSSSPTQINGEDLKFITREFLDALNLSINNKKFDQELPPVFVDGQISDFYYNNVFIAADLIVMSAFLIPPLDLIMGGKKKYRYQNIIIEKASQYLQYFITNLNSLQFIAYQTFPFIEFFRKNSNVILLTHDSVQYNILKSLNLPIFKHNVPFQSYIFIQSATQACVMYVAPDIDLSGVFKGFFTTLIWKGSNLEFEQKISNLEQLIDPEVPLYPVKPAFSLSGTFLNP